MELIPEEKEMMKRKSSKVRGKITTDRMILITNENGYFNFFLCVLAPLREKINEN
jgi:hypothetical protein